jgi:hypothetical protein
MNNGSLKEHLDIENRSSQAIAFARQCLFGIKETEDLARRLVKQIKSLGKIRKISYKFLSPETAMVTVIRPGLPETWNRNNEQDPRNIIRKMRNVLLDCGPQDSPRLLLTIKRSAKAHGYREGIGI